MNNPVIKKAGSVGAFVRNKGEICFRDNDMLTFAKGFHGAVTENYIITPFDCKLTNTVNKKRGHR